MQYLLFILSIILILYLVIPSYLMQKALGASIPAFLLKGVGTLFGLGFGLIGTLLYPNPHSYLVLLGLLLGLIGDVLLERSCPIGGVSFFFGNIVYLRCMLAFEPLTKQHYVILIFLSIVFILSFWNRSKHFGKLRFFVIPYGILIALMASFAIPFTLHMLYQNTSLSLFGFGAFLFVVSDYLLAYRILYDTKPSFHRISLGTYYIAQLCIGASLLL